jgi:hypothetical protein
MNRFAAEVTPTLEREVEAFGRHGQLMPRSENHSTSNPGANATATERVAR